VPAPTVTTDPVEPSEIVKMSGYTYLSVERVWFRKASLFNQASEGQNLADEKRR